MKPLVSQLSKNGELWIGTGGWGVQDFANIGTLLSSTDGQKTLKKNLQVLFEAWPALGVDFDMEESYDSGMQSTIVQFALLLDDLSKSSTFCPYVEEEFWLTCLADIYKKLGKQVVRRFNLQCYAGGNGNTTRQWLSQLESFDGTLGIPDPDAFIVPSTWVRSDDGTMKNSPSDVRAFFSARDIRQNAGGGFLWNTSEIFASGHAAEAYAAAIVDGLCSAK